MNLIDKFMHFLLDEGFCPVNNSAAPEAYPSKPETLIRELSLENMYNVSINAFDCPVFFKDISDYIYMTISFSESSGKEGVNFVVWSNIGFNLSSSDRNSKFVGSHTRTKPLHGFQHEFFLAFPEQTNLLKNLLSKHKEELRKKEFQYKKAIDAVKGHL